MALFAAAGFGAWSLHSTRGKPQPVAVPADGVRSPVAAKAGAETARKVEAAK